MKKAKALVEEMRVSLALKKKPTKQHGGFFCGENQGLFNGLASKKSWVQLYFLPCF